MKTKKGLLLINLGTPDDPGYLSVFKYLRQFLMDPKVITVPYILRFILVSLIIVPVSYTHLTLPTNLCV